MNSRHVLTSLLTVVGALACGDAPNAPNRIDVLATLARKDRVVYVEAGRALSHFVDPKTATIETRAIEPGSVLATGRNARDEEILVLSRSGSAEDDEVRTTLLLQSLEGERRFELGAQFSELAQSDDGRFALLHFGPTAVEQGIYNPNEIALVDLDSEPSAENPRFQTVRSLKGSFQRADFSPPMTLLGSGSRKPRIVVLLFDSVVTLLDLDDPDVEFTLELSRTEDLGLRQVLFSPAESTIYVRGDRADDLYVVTLSHDPGTDAGYSPSLQQIEAGAGPRDLALYGKGPEQRVVVAAAGSGAAVVIDADTSVTTTVPLGAAASRIHLFSGTSPRDDLVSDRALLYAPGSPALSFLDLEGVEESGTRNLEHIFLAAPVGNLVALDAGRVLLTHGSLDLGLSILDLQDRTVSQIRGVISGRAPLLDPGLGRLWLPTSSERVAYLDLESLHPREVRLNAAVETIHRVGEKLVAIHGSEVGYLSILDAAEPNPAEGTALRGFLLANLFEEGE